MRRRGWLRWFRTWNDLKVVIVTATLICFLKIIMGIHRLNKVDGVGSVTLSISHLYGKHGIYQNLVASNNMPSLDQSSSPGIYCGGPNLNPMAVNLAIASRSELLSMTSGIVSVGVRPELMVT